MEDASKTTDEELDGDREGEDSPQWELIDHAANTFMFFLQGKFRGSYSYYLEASKVYQMGNRDDFVALSKAMSFILTLTFEKVYVRIGKRLGFVDRPTEYNFEEIMMYIDKVEKEVERLARLAPAWRGRKVKEKYEELYPLVDAFIEHDRARQIPVQVHYAALRVGAEVGHLKDEDLEKFATAYEKMAWRRTKRIEEEEAKKRQMLSPPEDDIPF